jgi:Ni,Fe-hydrogenase III small subunit
MSMQIAEAPTSLQAEREQAAQLKKTLLHDIRRSIYVFRIDSGGCNACDYEIFASVTPVFDFERLGIKLVPSPRHADVLLCTGTVTRPMRVPTMRAYNAAPDPKIVIAYGACGCTGGIFYDLYGVLGGIDKILPVDVYIPGCPPPPTASIHGFAIALGLLDQKLKASHHVEAEGEQVTVAHPRIPYGLRVALEREARRMAGYRQGHEIAEKLFALMEQDDAKSIAQRVADFLARENDPRLTEIVHNLESIRTAGSGETDQ